MPQEDEFKSQVDSEELDREDDDEEQDGYLERDETSVFERDHFEKLADDVGNKGPARQEAPDATRARNPNEGDSHFKTILKELEESVSEDDEGVEGAGSEDRRASNSTVLN